MDMQDPEEQQLDQDTVEATEETKNASGEPALNDSSASESVAVPPVDEEDSAPAEEPTVEEADAEETGVEEVTVEEAAAEEIGAEDAAEETDAEDVTVEEIAAEETGAEDVTVEEAAAEETGAEEVTVEEAAAEETDAEDAAVEEVAAEETGAEDAAVEEVAAEETAAEATGAEDAAVEEVAAEETDAEATGAEDAAGETDAEDAAVEEIAAEETVAEETGVENEEDPSDWFVVHCYSGYENKVRHNLEQRIETMGMKNMIFDVVVPTQEEIEVKDGKRRIVERHIFPGYVLVNMILTEESWYMVRNTPGVTGFVGMGNEPTPLRPEEVLQIVKRMEADAPTVKVTFKEGERVRIIDGPFNDFRGVVAEIDMERTKVRVMVNFFGRETPVELDFLQVEKS